MFFWEGGPEGEPGHRQAQPRQPTVTNEAHLPSLVKCLCVFITAGPSTKLFAWGGGGGYGRTCATRDDEPRPVWTRLPITLMHYLLQLFAGKPV
jgi:hypothetical protein